MGIQLSCVKIPLNMVKICFHPFWPFFQRLATLCGDWPRGAAPHAPLHWLQCPVPPAAPTREPESFDLDQTRSTLTSGDFLSQRSLSIRPSSPAQTSTVAPGSALKRGRFLQFNCTGILYCHAEQLDFLYSHHSSGAGRLRARDQTRRELLSQGDHRICHIATVRCDRPTGGGGGGLVTLVYHSIPYRVPDSDILPGNDTEEVLAVETELGGTTLAHWPSSMYISPPASSCSVLSKLRLQLWSPSRGSWRPDGAWQL